MGRGQAYLTQYEFRRKLQPRGGNRFAQAPCGLSPPEASPSIKPDACSNMPLLTGRRNDIPDQNVVLTSAWLPAVFGAPSSSGGVRYTSRLGCNAGSAT
jgi:hypothetical protein